MLSSIISFLFLLCLAAAERDPVDNSFAEDEDEGSDHTVRNGLIGGLAGLAGLTAIIATALLARHLRRKNQEKRRPTMVLADPEKPEQPPVLVTPAPRRQSTPMEPIAEAHTPRPSNDIREPNTLPPTPESAPAPASASSRPGFREFALRIGGKSW